MISTDDSYYNSTRPSVDGTSGHGLEVYVNQKHNLIIYHQSSLGISSPIGKRQTRYVPSVRSFALSSLQSRPRAAPAPRVDATAKGRQRPKTLTASRGTWGLPVGAALSLTKHERPKLRTSTPRRRTSNLLRTYLLVSCSLHTPVSSCSCRLRSHLRSLRCDCAPSAIIHASNSES